MLVHNYSLRRACIIYLKLNRKSRLESVKMTRYAFYRIYLIVWMSIKFFTQVALFRRRHKGRFTPSVNEKWEQLVTKQAREYKENALKLGGLMIKLGQFLSTRADIMPPSFIRELEGLTDHVTPVPQEEAIALLDDEWGRDHKELLSNVSEEPVASASIGEVYKAYLEDGTAVAVKIQRPNIERILTVDFKAMRIVIWLAKRFTTFGKQLDFDLLYREMTDTIGAELNFIQEMKSGQNFAERFDDLEGIRFPVYFERYTTRRILVMEWIEGSRITDLAFLEANELDRRELAGRVFTLFLEQILEGGKFHADPHGGNILVQADGTIVLIDFGMIVNITPNEAQSIYKIVEGVIFRQYDRILDGLEEMNFLLPNADRKVLEDAIERVVSAYESDELNEMNSFVIDQLLDDLKEIVRTQPVQLPAEFAFLGRAVSTFVGVLHVLDPEVDLLAIGKPRIVEWAKEQTFNKASFSKKDAQRIALNAVGSIRKLPDKIFNYLEEPTRMREYVQRHDKDMKVERRNLQTRLFTGIIAVLSMTVLFFGIYDEHTPLILISGGLLLVSTWQFRRQAKV